MKYSDEITLYIEYNGNYETRDPIIKNINKINSLNTYKILYTARLETDRDLTVQWLNKNNIKYDALIMNKLPYSLLIDDKAIILGEMNNEKK